RCYRDWSSDVCSSDLICGTAIPHGDDQYRESMPAESWRRVIVLSARRALCYSERALLTGIQVAVSRCTTWPCAPWRARTVALSSCNLRSPGRPGSFRADAFVFDERNFAR